MSEKRKPLFIGLTGGVAAGKSTALAGLAEAGIPTLSADAVVHETYRDPEVVELVSGRLGGDVVVDGEIDRDAVAREIFSEPEARTWIEQLIWPRVGQRIIDFRKHWDEADDPPGAVVVEVPLLFESGMDQAFDKTIAVVTDPELRRERADARGHEEIDAREERQLSQDEKAERASIVVENHGSIEDLKRDAVAAVESLIAT